MSAIQTPQPVLASAPTRKLGLPRLFVGMIIRPRSTLAYLREAGGLSWLWPAGLAALMVVISIIVSAPISQAAAEKQFQVIREQMGDEISPAQEAQMQQAASFASNPVFIIVIPAITGIIGLAVGWLIRGGVVYLVSLLLGGQAKFGAMFRMAVWTTLPDIVRQIVTAVGALMTGRVLQGGLAALAPTSEGVAVPPMGAALLQTFLRGIDVYWLWGLALLTIGVAVTAQFAWRKGLIVAVGYWLLTVVFVLGTLAMGLSFAAQAGFAPR